MCDGEKFSTFAAVSECRKQQAGENCVLRENPCASSGERAKVTEAGANHSVVVPDRRSPEGPSAAVTGFDCDTHRTV